MEQKLSSIIKNKTYIITSVDSSNEDFVSRAAALGLRKGVTIVLKSLAPFFSDPLLFELEEGRVALTRTEADTFLAKELN